MTSSSFSSSSSFNSSFFFKNYFMCVFSYMYVYAPLKCLVSMEARKCYPVHWTWISRRLWVTMWVMEIKPRSSGRTTRGLNKWAIFSVEVFKVFLEYRLITPLIDGEAFLCSGKYISVIFCTCLHRNMNQRQEGCYWEWQLCLDTDLIYS